MIRLVEDVDTIAPAYLGRLNASFPGWGGAEMFDWCFRRRTGGPAADLFVVEEAGNLIAGSATTYRRALRSNDRDEPIGCMTGSWTVRAARGSGIFDALIEKSRAQARRRGCALLIAFAGAGKASRPGLLAAGAQAVEGAFLTSPADATEGGGPDATIPTTDETVAAFADRRFHRTVSRLVYSPDEWRGQMLERPSTVARWRLDDEVIALVEPGGEVDRLLDVNAAGGEPFVDAVRKAAAISNRAGRRLSTYSLDPWAIEALVAAGFDRSRAWLYLMSTDCGPVEDERWCFANGDRM